MGIHKLKHYRVPTVVNIEKVKKKQRESTVLLKYLEAYSRDNNINWQEPLLDITAEWQGGTSEKFSTHYASGKTWRLNYPKLISARWCHMGRICESALKPMAADTLMHTKSMYAPAEDESRFFVWRKNSSWRRNPWCSSLRIPPTKFGSAPSQITRLGSIRLCTLQTTCLGSQKGGCQSHQTY